MPPVSLPRRMWAGSQLKFNQPLRVGDEVIRTSTIEEVRSKLGRSGQPLFVKVRYELHANGAQQTALIEHPDIVYRDAPQAGEAAPSPIRAETRAETGAAWQRQGVPDDVLLFRYSALTFNGHRRIAPPDIVCLRGLSAGYPLSPARLYRSLNPSDAADSSSPGCRVA